MPSIPLHPTPSSPSSSPASPLPHLLQTPYGLAILEIQGTLHVPNSDPATATLTKTETPVGRLEFPLYNPDDDRKDTKWMKRAYLYVGKHQRLAGEVKKLPKAFAIVRKRDQPESEAQMELDNPGAAEGHTDEEPSEELEIVDIVEYRILFGSRPEPVGE